MIVDDSWMEMSSRTIIAITHRLIGALLLSAVTDSEDGNRLKLENISQFFQVLKLCLEKKNHKKLLRFALPAKFHLMSSL